MCRLTFSVQMLVWFAVIIQNVVGEEYEWKQWDYITNINALTFKGDTAWFGCNAGIGKFNITTGQTYFYTYSNSSSPITSAYSIAIDRNGTKWVGTSNGIASFNGNQWQYFNSANSALNSKNVTSVVVDSGNNIWFLCRPDYYSSSSLVSQYSGGGLLRYNGKDWHLYDSTDAGLRTSEIYQMAVGHNAIWLRTPLGLCCRYSDSTWKYFDSTNSPVPISYSNRIQTDPQGTLWVMWSQYATYPESGKNYFLSGLDTAGIWTTIKLNDSLPKGMTGGYALDFLIDQSGRFWFINNSAGIVLWDRKTWQPYYYLNSELPKSFLMESIAFDEMNRLWFTFRDTAHVFDIPKLTKFAIQSTTAHINVCNAITNDKNGIYWMASNGGVLRLEGDSFSVFDTLNSGLQRNGATKIIVDSLNRKLILCYGKIFIYNDSDWIPFESTGRSDDISDILFDKKGTLWLQYPTGLASHDKGTFNFTEIGQISSFDIDTSGKIWCINQYNKVLTLDNTGVVSKGPTGNKLTFWDIAAGPDGKIWCSTDSALYYYSENSWKHFDTLDIGIPDRVRPLTIDKKGNVWEYTSRGLMFYDGKSWAVANKSSNGMPKLVRLLHEDDKGNLWFQTSSGLAFRSIKKPVKANLPVGTKTINIRSKCILPYMGKPLKIALNKNAFTKVKICTINGKILRCFESDASNSLNSIIWNGKDESNQKVSTGMYVMIFSK